MGGIGESWTFYAYVLNGNFVDIMPSDEDQSSIQEMSQNQQHDIHQLNIDIHELQANQSGGTG
ncbi:hypothetical protein E2562_005854 [Oryza meyeriana var. granulata]|uniref:Uncharacterized protein n=1 Tax=Oryza meyeriana var. granulata TaxID=110450 RepID=A0A6G1CDZ1_9ORYZ|nr:hypothetical protein E2562_005854 [Oryza meyeriana var. granulata]